MKSIVILGTGNVAFHLFRALKKTSNFKVIQVFNHQPTSLEAFRDVPTTTNYDEILPADIFIISVKDDKISNVSKNLNSRDALVVHTAGGKTMNILNKHKRTGVIYPLQTFSKKRDIVFENIPVCIEANSDNDLKLLENLATEISGNIYKIDSTQRSSLHVAAVFVSNFVNYLYSEGEQICLKNDIPFEILLPLIRETAEKVTNISPGDAQTGPAIRNDQEVINSHMEMLNEDQKKIYLLLTQSIQHLHGKKL